MNLKILLALFSLWTLSSAQASLCIAHRGYSSEYLENSLEAMLEAIHVGSDGIEFDIRFTKDQVAVLMHDSTMKKTVMARSKEHDCPVDRGVSDFTYAWLNENCMLKNGEDIPRLKDLLDEVSDFDGYLFFDLKEFPPQNFFELLMLKNIRDIETVRFLSFQKRFLQEIKRQRPHANTLLLSFLFPRGLFHTGINVNQRTRNFLFPFRWLGKETGVWTTNSYKQIARALKRKVTFLTTDYPERCLKAQGR